MYRIAPGSKIGWKFSARINGAVADVSFDKGYATITRNWRPGDTVTIDWPMPVQRILCNEKVEVNRGRVALQRGPIVYCVEHPDMPEGKVANLILPDDAPLTTERREDLLGGVTVITGPAQSACRAMDNGSKKMIVSPVKLIAIPYYAWAHRGRGQMLAWLARTQDAVAPVAMPTIASQATPSASRGNAAAVNDQREPKSSGDHTHPFLHFWPNKGSAEWVQYDFDKPHEVSQVEVYWFDDTGRGAYRLPASWKLLYRKDDKWVEVADPSGCGTEGDQYNRTQFEPVTTDGMRIEIQLQEKWAGGVHEWRVQ